MDSNEKTTESKACTQPAERVAAPDIELKVTEDVPPEGSDAAAENQGIGSSTDPIAEALAQSFETPCETSGEATGESTSESTGETVGEAAAEAVQPAEAPAPNLSLHASAIPLSIKPEMSTDWPLSRKKQIFNVVYFGVISLQLIGLVEQGVAPYLALFCLGLCGLFTAASVFYLFNHRHHQTASDEFSPRVRRSLRAAGLLIPAFMLMGIGAHRFGNQDSIGQMLPPAPIIGGGGDFDAEMKAGRADYKKHRLGDALSHFERASAIDPSSDAAFEWIGETNDSMHKYPAALVSSLHAIELNPDNENAHVVAAHGFLMTGRFDDSLAYAQQAAQLNPEDGEAYGYQSRALNMLGRHDEALIADNSHVKYHNYEARAFDQRAETLESMGRMQEAKYDHNLAEQIRNSHGIAN